MLLSMFAGAACLTGALFALTLVPRRRLLPVLLLLVLSLTAPVWSDIPPGKAAVEPFPGTDEIEVLVVPERDAMVLILPASVPLPKMP